MRVRYSGGHYQLLFLLFFSTVLSGCRRGSEELPVMPPPTNPLSREYIGFGVVNVSFTDLFSESDSSGVSLGYLRRGTVVRIIERRLIVNRSSEETWVYVEGNYQGQGSVSSGWLPETVLVIYDSESRANTASRTMGQ